jgi:hypothetical protein
LADVELQKTPYDDIALKEAELIKQQSLVQDVDFIIDPRAELASCKKEGMPQTLIDYDEIKTLAEQATKIYADYLNKPLLSFEGRIFDDEVDLKEMARLVQQNHKAKQEHEKAVAHEGKPVVLPKRLLKKVNEEKKKQK